jgi:ADP-L-glycero-D-manno-heptose 6-epimerase
LSLVLITGSNGFIGKYLIKRAVDAGHEVESLDTDYFGGSNWISNLVKELNRIKPKAIFHVGACSDTLENDVDLMMQRNYESTKVISNWCSSTGCKMIFSSSAAAYGVEGKYPSNLYGWSKYVAEDYVCKSGGVSLRYFNVYGPGEEKKGKMASFLFQAYSSINSGGKVFLFPGKPTRDFVYIDDIASANLHAFENYDSLAGHFYDVGAGESRSFEDVLTLASIGYSYLDEDKIPKGYQFFTLSKTEKWMQGWNPAYPLERGVSEYLNYLKYIEPLQS